MLIHIEDRRRKSEKEEGNVRHKTPSKMDKLALKWNTLYYAKTYPDLHKNLENMRLLYTYTNATPIRLHSRVGYKCAFCNEQYPAPNDLKMHTIHNHKDINIAYFMTSRDRYKLSIKLDITGLTCNICSETIESLDKITDHLSFIHNKTYHRDIKSYIVPFKFDTEMLQCCLCVNTFSKFKTLLEHMNNHYRNYVCGVCDAGFINKLKLQDHEVSHRDNEFKCDECSKVFNTERKRKVHIQIVHLGDNLKIKCGYCDEKFKDSRRKDKHIISVHGGIPLSLKCQACEKVFTSQKSLSIHTKRDHLMERRHKCSQCDMRFFTTSELKLHMAKHTKIREFTCHVCLKGYARHKTLKEHMRIHDNDRRFKCEYCGQAFVQKCSWRGHMRSKHGELV